MKRLKICAAVFLLLTLLLTGCSADALAQRGVDLLDKLFAGDASEPRMSVKRDPDPSSASQADPEPAGQEPAEPQFPDAVEPSIPVQPSADPEPPASDPVPAGPAGDITPSHTDATFFGPGESFRYLPEGVTGVYACTYASEDPAVASVDPDTGRVTAVGPGTTKVTMHVECNGQYDFSCIIRCSWKDSEQQPSLPAEDGKPDDPPSGGDGISASHSDATFFNPKEHFQFLPVGADAGYSCTYATGDAGVASVDEKGTVTAVGPGTTTVTMTVDGGGTEYIFECIVRCKWS